MKNHFHALFSTVHRRVTLILMILASLLIVMAGIIGITDNLPGITTLYAGILLLFLSFVHVWQKWENYAIMCGACAILILLVWLGIHFLMAIGKPQYISEAVVMILLMFICVPGILVGITGAIYWSLRRNR
jgi:hypothetical protein